MDIAKEIKGFARWIIIQTSDVDTMGPCRRYKGRIYNVDELFEIYRQLK